MKENGPTTRFAPSPTGRLHLGHAASALFAFEKAAGGRFLLRIEDIDPVRCQAAFSEGIEEDLAWLGLEWEKPVRRQSEHRSDYAAALERLRGMGLLYPCFCTRKEVEREAALAAAAPHEGEEGPFYAGTCRMLSESQRQEKLAQGRMPVWRLDMEKALGLLQEPLRWHDAARGWQEACPQRFGDVVLARRDVGASYHIAVVCDDALQEVSCVTRGADLLAVTDVHVLLQKTLGLPQPAYHHHPLLCDASGRRFAKRDGSVTLRALREAGARPEDILQKVRCLRLQTGF